MQQSENVCFLIAGVSRLEKKKKINQISLEEEAIFNRCYGHKVFFFILKFLMSVGFEISSLQVNWSHTMINDVVHEPGLRF